MITGNILYKSITVFVGTTVSFLYGEWTGLLSVLIAMIAIDYITGLLASFIEGKLCSSIGFKGIAKKVFILAIVAVAHLLDQVLIGQHHLIRDATIFFYISNELLSIIKNAGRAGIPLPTRLKNAIVLLRNKSK